MQYQGRGASRKICTPSGQWVHVEFVRMLNENGRRVRIYNVSQGLSNVGTAREYVDDGSWQFPEAFRSHIQAFKTPVCSRFNYRV